MRKILYPLKKSTTWSLLCKVSKRNSRFQVNKTYRATDADDYYGWGSDEWDSSDDENGPPPLPPKGQTLRHYRGSHSLFGGGKEAFIGISQLATKSEAVSGFRERKLSCEGDCQVQAPEQKKKLD